MKNQMTRRTVLGGALAFASQAAFADAPTTTMRPLQRGKVVAKPTVTAEEIIRAAKLSGKVSFAIVDLKTGEPLASRDAVRLQPPASITKAVTAGFALDRLAPDFRFKTRVLHTGTIVDGVINGDVILQGGGDPVLETDHLANLAQQMADRGIWRVTGRLLISDGKLPRLFEIDPSQPPQVGYNPSVSGLNLNFNRVRFDWARRTGGAYKMTMQATGNVYAPDTPVSRVVVGERDLPVYTHRMRGESEEWSVARTALGKEGGRWLPTRVPELYAGEAFSGIARALGIQMPLPVLAPTPEGAVEIARHISPELNIILHDMLRYSTNLTAEVMGFTASGKPDLPTSAANLTEWARGWGIGGAFADHSGLSDSSLVSAQGMANFMAAHAQKSLPNVMRAAPLRRKGSKQVLPDVFVRAKTGSLNFVSTLSGYLEIGDHTFAFAILSADMLRRDAIKPGDRERPAGGGTWAKRARSLQYDLLRHWAAGQLS